MGADFTLALKLLGVGMITVFLILFLVVIFGNLIIRFVNQFYPEEKVVPASPSTSPSLEKKRLAAVVAAVNITTQGRGKVTRIEKL